MNVKAHIVGGQTVSWSRPPATYAEILWNVLSDQLRLALEFAGHFADRILQQTLTFKDGYLPTLPTG